MSLLERIVELVPKKENVFISITGGGGKSSLMKSLAARFRSEGKKVLITTSTQIQSYLFFDWGTDKNFTFFEEAYAYEPDGPCTVLYASNLQDNVQKLKAPFEERVHKMSRKYDVTICEADGSRHLPLKYHTARDPVIYPFSDLTIAVLGAWAYGKEAWEVTYGYDGDNVVDQAFLNNYIKSPDGLLKGRPDYVLVNGLDGGVDPQPFKDLAWPEGTKVLGGSLMEDKLEFEL